MQDDHELASSTYGVLEQRNGGFERVDHPALNALNARLRDDFLDDCNLGVTRWNQVIEDAGIDFRLRLPHVAFHRQIGLYADLHVSPEGGVSVKKSGTSVVTSGFPGTLTANTSKL